MRKQVGQRDSAGAAHRERVCPRLKIAVLRLVPACKTQRGIILPVEVAPYTFEILGRKEYFKKLVFRKHQDTALVIVITLFVFDINNRGRLKGFILQSETHKAPAKVVFNFYFILRMDSIPVNP